ncbi:MAG: response regulator [Deltaproteobacteria bacterium]|nr:response regulator [Deltaproteobacteria bacterium]
MTAAKGKNKILVIDDEPHIVGYLKVLLEDNGYSVVSSTNPACVIKMAGNEKPDLICLDIMMPRQTGLSLYKDIRQNQILHNIPVVVISAVENAVHGFKKLFDRLTETNGITAPDAFFEKPINAANLLNFINTTLKPNLHKDNNTQTCQNKQ